APMPEMVPPSYRRLVPALRVSVVQASGLVWHDAEQQPGWIAHDPPLMHLELAPCPQSLEPGNLGFQVVGVDVDMHSGLAGSDPLHEQAKLLTGQVGHVVLGILERLGHLLAYRPLPECQFLGVDFSRYVDDDPAQPAVMRHGSLP